MISNAVRTLSLALILACLTPAIVHAANVAEDNRPNLIVYLIHIGMGRGPAAPALDDVYAFIDKEITPRFPKGQTITEARGQWLNPDDGSITRETTMVVEVQADAVDAAVSEKHLKDIAAAYIAKYRQANVSVYVTKTLGVDATLYYDEAMMLTRALRFEIP